MEIQISSEDQNLENEQLNKPEIQEQRIEIKDEQEQGYEEDNIGIWHPIKTSQIPQSILNILKKEKRLILDAEKLRNYFKQVTFFEELLRKGFSDISDLLLYEVWSNVELRELPQKTIIFKEKEPSNNEMFIILEGKVGISVQMYLSDKKMVKSKAKGRVEIIRKESSEESESEEENNSPFPALGNKIAELFPGKAFGDQALLKDGGFRNASVYTLEPSRFLVIKRQKFRGVLNLIDKIKYDKIDRISKVVPMFNEISSKMLRDRLIYEFEEIQLLKGTFLTKEGEKGDSIYILRSGRVSLEKNIELEEFKEKLSSVAKKIACTHQICEINTAELIGEEILKEKSPYYNSAKNLRPIEYIFTSRVLTSSASFLKINKKRLLTRFPRYIVAELRQNMTSKLQYRLSLVQSYVDKIQNNFVDHHRNQLSIISNLQLQRAISSTPTNTQPSPSKKIQFTEILRNSILPLGSHKQENPASSQLSLLKELHHKSKDTPQQSDEVPQTNLSVNQLARPQQKRLLQDSFFGSQKVPLPLPQKSDQQFFSDKIMETILVKEKSSSRSQPLISAARIENSSFSEQAITPQEKGISSITEESNTSEGVQKGNLLLNIPPKSQFLKHEKVVSQSSIKNYIKEISPPKFAFISDQRETERQDYSKREKNQEESQNDNYLIRSGISKEKQKMLNQLKQARVSQISKLMEGSICKKEVIFEYMKSFQQERQLDPYEDVNLKAHLENVREVQRIVKLNEQSIKQDQQSAMNSKRKNSRDNLQIMSIMSELPSPTKKDKISEKEDFIDKRAQAQMGGISQVPKKYYMLQETWDMGNENLKLKELDLKNGLFRKGKLLKPPLEATHKEYFEKMDEHQIKMYKKYVEKKNESYQKDSEQISNLITLINRKEEPNDVLVTSPSHLLNQPYQLMSNHKRKKSQIKRRSIISGGAESRKQIKPSTTTLDLSLPAISKKLNQRASSQIGRGGSSLSHDSIEKLQLDSILPIESSKSAIKKSIPNLKYQVLPSPYMSIVENSSSNKNSFQLFKQNDGHQEAVKVSALLSSQTKKDVTKSELYYGQHFLKDEKFERSTTDKNTSPSSFNYYSSILASTSKDKILSQSLEQTNDVSTIKFNNKQVELNKSRKQGVDEKYKNSLKKMQSEFKDILTIHKNQQSNKSEMEAEKLNNNLTNEQIINISQQSNILSNNDCGMNIVGQEVQLIQKNKKSLRF